MDILTFVVLVTSFILTIEFLATIWLGFNLIKKLPRVSAPPIVLSCLVSLLVFIYTWTSLIHMETLVFEPLKWVIFTRTMVMLLMGSPVWIMLAVSNVPCKECMLLEKGVS